MNRDWWTAAELAEARLNGLPGTESAVIRLAKREDWRERRRPDGSSLARVRQGRGGGWEYHVSLLPTSAMLDLTKRNAKAAKTATPAAAVQREQAATSASWAIFDRLPETKKTVARERLAVIEDVLKVEAAGGLGRHASIAAVAYQRKISKTTVWNWFGLVRGIARGDWLPALAPQHKGRTTTAACTPEAWEMLKADWLRQEKPSFQSCYRRLERVAKEQGWSLPAARTLERRMLSEVPHAVQVLAREGNEALASLYPAQKRDRTMLHACEAFVADGHTWDLEAIWPDGTVSRPVMVAVTDLYSNRLVAWRIGRSENKDLIRLAYGDAFRDFGVPEIFVLDNGRAFASKWLTGGQKTRYRFKVRPEEPDGVLTSLGCDVRWTLPYSGRSKPIERSFRDYCDDIARHPAFSGAYVGNAPGARPENAGHPVAIDTFMKVLHREFDAWNNRPGRRTDVCGGTLSYAQAFADSYAKSPIRRAAPEQLRMCMLAAESITARRPSGELHLAGNRYWADFLPQWAGRKLTVRVDPANLHGDMAVYRPDGAHLGDAPCIAATGFFDAEAARARAQDVARYRKAQKAMLAVERRLGAADVAAMLAGLPDAAPAMPDDPKIVRMVPAASGASGNEPAEPAEVLDFWDLHGRGMKRLQEKGGAG